MKNTPPFCNYVFTEPWNVGQCLHLHVTISSPVKDVIVSQDLSLLATYIPSNLQLSKFKDKNNENYP